MTPKGSDRSESDSDVSIMFGKIKLPIEKELKNGKQLKYLCKVCNQRFKRKTCLDRHEFTHTGIKKYTCPHETCTKTYKVIQHLKRHQQISHPSDREESDKGNENLPCKFSECNKTFKTYATLQKHVKELHENPKIFTCSTCLAEFRRKIQLRKHQIEHTGQFPFTCAKCKSGFLYEALFERHISIPSLCKANKIYSCDRCDQNFPNWSSLVQHRRAKHSHSHSLNIKCESCLLMFPSRSELRKHKEAHKTKDNTQLCPLDGCTRTFLHSRNLKMHIRLKHDGKSFKCTANGCDKNLSTKQKLFEHFQKFHKTENPISENSGEKSNQPKKQKFKKEKILRKDFGRRRKRYTAAVLAGIELGLKIEKAVMEDKVDVAIVTTSECETEQEQKDLKENHCSDGNIHEIIENLLQD